MCEDFKFNPETDETIEDGEKSSVDTRGIESATQFRSSVDNIPVDEFTEK